MFPLNCASAFQISPDQFIAQIRLIKVEIGERAGALYYICYNSVHMTLQCSTRRGKPPAPPLTLITIFLITYRSFYRARTRTED